MLTTQIFVGIGKEEEVAKKMKSHPDFSEREIKWGISQCITEGFIRFEIFDKESKNGNCKGVVDRLCDLVEGMLDED